MRRGAHSHSPKPPSPTTFSEVGQVITYTYVVTNNGTEDFDFSDVEVNDDILWLVCSIPPTFAVGDSETCTGTYTITAADVTAGSVTEHCDRVAAILAGSASSKLPAASVTVDYDPHADWTLVKTPDPTTYAGPGEVISYSYDLTNTGNVAISAIAITDDKVALVTCPATTLAVGASMTCTGTYTTNEGDVTAGSVVNNATATGTPAGGVLAPATDAGDDQLCGGPGLDAWPSRQIRQPIPGQARRSPTAIF